MVLQHSPGSKPGLNPLRDQDPTRGSVARGGDDQTRGPPRPASLEPTPCVCNEIEDKPRIDTEIRFD